MSWRKSPSAVSPRRHWRSHWRNPESGLSLSASATIEPVRIGDAETLEDAALAVFHARGIARAFVIVSQKMQDAVHDQVPNVMRQRLALVRGFARHGLERQHHVAEKFRLAAGERQHIGRRVLAAPAFVEGTNRGVVAQYDAQLAAATAGIVERRQRRLSRQFRDTGKMLAPRGADCRHVDNERL